MRFRARVDNGQKEIVEYLRKAGFSVFHTHQIGGGFPDLVIGKAGQTWLIEIKSEKGKLKQNQVEFRDNWKGSPVQTFFSLQDAIEFSRGF